MQVQGTVRRLPTPTPRQERANHREADTGEDIRVIENYLLETCIRYHGSTVTSLL